jgi:D-glycero-alpha-D-manno-heptose-7-phosphate kinase
LLFFIGVTRNSKVVLSKQLEHIKKNNQDTINSLHYVRGLVEEFKDSLNKSDIGKVGELLHKGWMAKRKFTEGVSNERIDKIYEAALEAGAIGGKLTGAGGGGHILLYCESSKKRNIITKMQNLGLRHVPFRFHTAGIKILNLYEYSK